jgi:hypothetical protein
MALPRGLSCGFIAFRDQMAVFAPMSAYRRSAYRKGNLYHPIADLRYGALLLPKTAGTEKKMGLAESKMAWRCSSAAGPFVPILPKRMRRSAWENTARKRIHLAFGGEVERSPARYAPGLNLLVSVLLHLLKGPPLPQKCFCIEHIGDQFC